MDGFTRHDASVLRRLLSLPLTEECRLQLQEIARKIDAIVDKSTVDHWHVKLMYKKRGIIRPTFEELETQIGSKEEATEAAREMARRYLEPLIQAGDIEEWEVRLTPLISDC